MNIRQWVGFVLALAGGSGITQHNGLEYLIASIMVLVAGCLLWFIPSKRHKEITN
jgi:hypothetical protein